MYFSRLVWVAALGSLAAISLGQGTFDVEHSELSALIDTSNTSGSSTQYDVFFSRSDGDPDLYINDVVWNPGSNWDSDIDFNMQAGQFFYNGGQTYVFGTAISGDQFWSIDSIINRFGAISNVDEGIYDFTLDFIGGENAGASDSLASFQLTLEVIERIDVAVTGVATPDTIGIGQETSISMTVENLMGARDFVSTTWYYTHLGLATELQNVGFFGNWFDQTITAGTSRTDEHTRWLATASTTPGTHEGHMGVYGGLYNGDWHSFAMDPKPMVTVVVPEPATMFALGIGLLALRRRRSA